MYESFGDLLYEPSPLLYCEVPTANSHLTFKDITFCYTTTECIMFCPNSVHWSTLQRETHLHESIYLSFHIKESHQIISAQGIHY